MSMPFVELLKGCNFDCVQTSILVDHSFEVPHTHFMRKIFDYYCLCWYMFIENLKLIEDLRGFFLLWTVGSVILSLWESEPELKLELVLLCPVHTTTIFMQKIFNCNFYAAIYGPSKRKAYWGTEGIPSSPGQRVHSFCCCKALDKAWTCFLTSSMLLVSSSYITCHCYQVLHMPVWLYFSLQIFWCKCHQSKNAWAGLSSIAP